MPKPIRRHKNKDRGGEIRRKKMPEKEECKRLFEDLVEEMGDEKCDNKNCKNSWWFWLHRVNILKQKGCLDYYNILQRKIQNQLDAHPENVEEDA